MSRSTAVGSPASSVNVAQRAAIDLSTAQIGSEGIALVPLTLNGQAHIASPTIAAQPTEKILQLISESLGKSLSLAEIIAGKGADPRNEIFNYDVTGHAVVDGQGNTYELLYWFDASADEDCALGLALTHMSDGRETWVSHYRLNGSFSEVEAKSMSQRMFRAIEQLGRPDTFEAGLRALDNMETARCVEHTSFEFSVEVPHFHLQTYEAELADWLRRKEVPIDSWGRGESKPLSCLVKELLSGEGEISFENGEIYLSNHVPLLWVENPDGSKRIIELCQEFTDGRPYEERIRVRRNLGGMPAEKKTAGETAIEAAIRGLREELGITKFLTLEPQEVTRRLEPSKCFPGLIKRNVYHPFRVVIPQSEVKPRYIENSRDKNSYFGWIDL